MDNEYSLNCVEYVYDKKAEGKLLLARIGLVALYTLFVITYFVICYVSGFIPVFALCPVFVWMLVYFTWRYVKFDVYYTFEHGNIEIGRMVPTKNGKKKLPRHTFNYNSIIFANDYKIVNNTDMIDNVKCYDYSNSIKSDKNIIIAFKTDNQEKAVIVEAIPAFQRLLKSYVKEKYKCD